MKKNFSSAPATEAGDFSRSLSSRQGASRNGRSRGGLLASTLFVMMMSLVDGAKAIGRSINFTLSRSDKIETDYFSRVAIGLSPAHQ